MNRWTTAALLAAGLALGAGPGRVLAEDAGEGPEAGDAGTGGSGAGGAGGGAPAGGGTSLRSGGGHGRLADDLRVKLSLSGRRSGSPTAKIAVKNRGSNAEAGIAIELRADSETGALLGSWTADLAPGAVEVIRIQVTPPAGTAVLVATAALNGAVDLAPSDNVARANLGPAGPSGSTGDAAVGAAIFSSSCASCHGTDAKGTGRAPWIVGASSGRIAEAIAEGEDGMPTFPGLSRSDIQALAAFLKDPGAVAPPPVTPPAPGTAPTYAGQIKAILAANCAACHTGASAPLGIRLDSYAAASANASAALAAVQAGRMPKGGPLPAADVQLLADWIAGGMKK